MRKKKKEPLLELNLLSQNDWYKTFNTINPIFSFKYSYQVIFDDFWFLSFYKKRCVHTVDMTTARKTTF